MATTLHRVRENFLWRVEAISPTATESGKRFVRIDPIRIIKEEAAAVDRAFVVTYVGSGVDQGVTDLYQRVAEHRWLVEILYSPQTRSYDGTLDLILQDRHDLIVALRDDAGYVGYSDDNSTDDLSLIERSRLSDELLAALDDPLWILRQAWRTLVKEID